MFEIALLFFVYLESHHIISFIAAIAKLPTDSVEPYHHSLHKSYSKMAHTVQHSWALLWRYFWLFWQWIIIIFYLSVFRLFSTIASSLRYPAMMMHRMIGWLGVNVIALAYCAINDFEEWLHFSLARSSQLFLTFEMWGMCEITPVMTRRPTTTRRESRACNSTEWSSWPRPIIDRFAVFFSSDSEISSSCDFLTTFFFCCAHVHMENVRWIYVSKCAISPIDISSSNCNKKSLFNR